MRKRKTWQETLPICMAGSYCTGPKEGCVEGYSQEEAVHCARIELDLYEEQQDGCVSRKGAAAIRRWIAKYEEPQK